MSKTAAELIQEAIDMSHEIEDYISRPSIGVGEFFRELRALRGILDQAKLKIVESSKFPRVER